MLKQIEQILLQDLPQETVQNIIEKLKKNKSIAYAEKVLQIPLSEKYKDNQTMYDHKMEEITGVLHQNFESSSQSKSNAQTRMLSKTGSIKGLILFVVSVLFALVIAYFLAK